MFRSACQHLKSSPEDVKGAVDLYKQRVAGISSEGRLWENIDIEWAPEAINTYEQGVKARFRDEERDSERL